MAQKYVNYLGHHLHVHYDVIDNLKADWRCNIELTLTNTGQLTIHNNNWQMYFHNFHMIEKQRLEKTGTALIPEYGVQLSHVNGGLFKMEPTELFKPLLPGGVLKMSLVSAYYIIARTDFMPNWYVVSPRTHPRILDCTKDEALTFVGSFDSPKKWKRQSKDTFNPYTSEKRFRLNMVEDAGKITRHVVPTPVEMSISDASILTIDLNTWVIVSEHGLKQEAEYLSGIINVFYY